MGLKIKSVIATFLMIISLTTVTEAAWEGPVEIISGAWGSGVLPDDFGTTNLNLKLALPCY